MRDAKRLLHDRLLQDRPLKERPLHDRPGHLLRRAHQKNVAIFLETTADFKITPLQFAVLKALEELGPSTQRSISLHIAMEPSNTHPMLRRMKESGLIDIASDQNDKRRSVISMTEAGQNMLEQVRPYELQSGDVLLENLNDKQKQSFIELLSMILED